MGVAAIKAIVGRIRMWLLRRKVEAYIKRQRRNRQVSLILWHINEYNKIQEGKSDLPESKRDEVESNFAAMLASGHIKLHL